MTTAIVSCCNVDDPLTSGFENDNLYGMVPGQILRFTVFNPDEPDSRGGGVTKLGSKLLTIRDGTYVGESDEVIN